MLQVNLRYSSVNESDFAISINVAQFYIAMVSCFLFGYLIVSVISYNVHGFFCQSLIANFVLITFFEYIDIADVYSNAVRIINQ